MVTRGRFESPSEIFHSLIFHNINEKLLLILREFHPCGEKYNR